MSARPLKRPIPKWNWCFPPPLPPEGECGNQAGSCGQGHDASFEAAELKKGCCLHVAAGQGVVASVARPPVTMDDVAFTIGLAGPGLVAAVGVYTHAKMAKL